MRAAVLEMKYGRSVLTARAPASWNIQRLRPVPQERRQDEAAVVNTALDHPVASPRLEEFLNPGDLLTIIVSDKTRRCRSDLFLPLILERVHAAGVDDADVVILFAAGTHAPQTEIEQREILGDAVFERYRIEEHDSRLEGPIRHQGSGLRENSITPEGSEARQGPTGRQASAAPAWIHVGTTRFGTDVLLNPLAAGQRKIIATGTIVHHYFAGYGGGPKLFVPGCSKYSTAIHNHRHTLLEDGSFHPGCSDGRVAGNPVIEDIQDAVRFFPSTFYFAALLDEDGRIADAVSGDILKAHAEGSRKVDEKYRIPVRRLSDITVVSTGGFPKDINLIQAHKAIHHAHYATREGGAIICLAECVEGLGNSNFLGWFADETDENFRRRVLDDYSMNAHTAVSLRTKTLRHTIILVSSLDEAIVRKMGMTPVENLEQAFDLADKLVGGRGSRSVSVAGKKLKPFVYLIENGSLTVPEYHEP